MKRLASVALLALVACGNQDPTAASPPTPQSVSPASAPETASPPPTAGSTTTTTPPTTSTLPPVDPLQAWSESTSSYEKTAGPSMRNVPPVGVRSNGERVELLSWDGQSWVARPLSLGESEIVHELWVTDVTADGVDEVVVSFFLGQDVFGVVFVNNAGTYVRAPVDNTANRDMAPGLLPNPQIAGGSVQGLEETCEPSCATGAILTVGYDWTGNSFVALPGACLDYRAITYGDEISVCTKGGMIPQLQEALIYFGYMRGPADGYFGPASRNALVKYQREVGLFESGTISVSDYVGLIEYYHQSESGDW